MNLRAHEKLKFAGWVSTCSWTLCPLAGFERISELLSLMFMDFSDAAPCLVLMVCISSSSRFKVLSGNQVKDQSIVSYASVFLKQGKEEKFRSIFASWLLSLCACQWSCAFYFLGILLRFLWYGWWRLLSWWRYLPCSVILETECMHITCMLKFLEAK